MIKGSEAGIENGQPVMNLTMLEQAVEQLTGESIDVIRHRTVWEQRRAIEDKTRKQVQIVSRFPFIGRGNVLRNRLISGEEVNRRIDRALDSV